MGICFGVAYKTPDILVSADNIAVKESDNLLYSLTRKSRNFVVKTWARQNGQNKILSHAKYSDANKRLKCDDHGCVYKKKNNRSVLLAYKREDVLKNCKNVDLIIQLNKFAFSACDTQTIIHNELEVYGTYSIWLKNGDIKVKRTRSNRPWHKA